jgi:TPR repeat protein
MRPSFDSQPARQDYNDNANTTYANETVHTPVSMASEDFRRSGDFASNPAPSYTYTKFNLPRGRPVDRRSVGIEDFFKSQITWDQPSQNQERPPSPDSPPRSFESSRIRRDFAAARNASFDHGAPSLTSSNSTIRARVTSATDITAQEHCDVGLELHEAGELLKSTYHLRLAARAGLPEAMFWYGLACRHGWGMRENKAEALQWLRRAVDSGQLEVAEDEDQSKHGQPTDQTKKKQHRAQYAVAIYELGKCYMNGWGAAQDKPLALRCYEIAGNWGDADALVEAGYCYAEAVGCKKDMKKAARCYRAAEAKGVSMVGNSWIYKDKYMDDGATVPDSRSVRSGRSGKKDYSEKKSRDKSRTRTIFGRKKSNTASST